jgi:hypothetical protein
MSGLPAWLRDAGETAGAVLAATSTARLVFHAYKVHAGQRAAFGMMLLLECGVAVLMAMVAIGAAEYLGLTTGTAMALAAVLGWLGPKGIEALVLLRLTGRGGKDGGAS